MAEGAFTLDFDDGDVIEWHATPEGVTTTRITDYTPTIYVALNESHPAVGASLTDLEAVLADDRRVERTDFVERRTSLHDWEPTTVLRVEPRSVDHVGSVARRVRNRYERGTYPPGTFRLFNVDLKPGFRYCLETGTDPRPKRSLSTFSVRIAEDALADRDVTALEIDGKVVKGCSETVLRILQSRLDRTDPDVLVLNDGRLVEVLSAQADECGIEDFALGRRPGWTQLTAGNTYEHEGRLGYGPATFTVPGRVVIDTTNSFLWGRGGLDGLRYFVDQSRKPLEEVGRASIGTVLTAIEIREAHRRGVLVPWNKWEPESFKDARTLHAADRGGFIFQPDVGCHENVFEVDFSSLYPNVICEHNISPETVLCDCHPDRSTIPELGYNVCEREGFLPTVLQPLIDDRTRFKRTILDADVGEDAVDADGEIAAARAKSNAIKWVLVSCFGYQGYRNAKFGRIECHEAINAVARDVLLTAKERFEDGGWEVVHGIVDSLWVTPTRDDHEPLVTVTDAISDAVGIELDREHHYDWICFVPKRGVRTPALTKYFGKVAGRGEYKIRGIEARQRSTPTYVADAQRTFIETFDAHRDPESVCDRLQRELGRLRSGGVDPADLIVTKRVSKPLGEYTQRTHTVAALQRAESHGVEKQPGRAIQYVVVDDDARTRERVRLDFEEPDSYDADFYANLLVRACESVVSPLGWDRSRIKQYLRKTRDVRLSAFE